MDWMVKAWPVSPTSYTWPSRVAMQMPNQSGFGLGQLGDVGGHSAIAQRLVFGVQFLQIRLDRRGRA
jgi:hypothetical protein